MFERKLFPALRQYYRCLRLTARGLPPHLALALCRLSIWPDPERYDRGTGWLHLSDFGLDVRMENGSLLARGAGLTFDIETIEDFYTLQDVLIKNVYSELLALNFAGNTCVLDVGMNLGAATLLSARQPGVTAVYGYEPFVHTFDLASRALRRNPEHAAKVKAFRAGLSDGEREETTTYATEWKASAQTERLSVTDTGLPGPKRTETVRLLDAADVLRSIRIENPGTSIIAKIDCEGAEYGIIRRLAETGQLEHLAAADIECHADPAEIERALTAAGFLTARHETATPGYVIVTARRRDDRSVDGDRSAK